MQRPPRDAWHLGDGAYVSYDGFQFILWAERREGWHYVALEPRAIRELVAYAERTTK